MPELNVSRIRIPNGNYLNIRDSQVPDVNAALEAILNGSGLIEGTIVPLSTGTVINPQCYQMNNVITVSFQARGTYYKYNITGINLPSLNIVSSSGIVKYYDRYNDLQNNNVTITIKNANTIYFDGGYNGDNTEAIITLFIKVNERPQVYGVSWDKSSSHVFTRTDDASSFSDPQTYTNNSYYTSYTNSFNTLWPWCNMENVEIIDSNYLVPIYKFYYKITNSANEFKIQISDLPQDGFHVSPAHADRGDGNGERDVVYIGAYKCCAYDYTSNYYKNNAVQKPKANITRETARTAIRNLGTGYYQQDFAMWWTLRMLYLVEFADWDVQSKIGYGRGNGSSLENMNQIYTYYHSGTGVTYKGLSGTKQSSKTTYGIGVQYRGICDLWANSYEFVDGIRFDGANVYVFNNPNEFSDTTGGTLIGTRPTSNGVPTDFSIPSVTGFEWALIPSAVTTDSTYSSYVCDLYEYSASGITLVTGGNYSQTQASALFRMDTISAASKTGASYGTRLMYLP